MQTFADITVGGCFAVAMTAYIKTSDTQAVKIGVERVGNVRQTFSPTDAVSSVRKIDIVVAGGNRITLR